MGLTNQLSQGYLQGRNRGHPPCAAMGSHPLTSAIFLHEYVRGGRSISLSLCGFVCKTGIHQFVPQDQMSSWGGNMLTLNILWILRAYQCDMGSDWQHAGLYYKRSYGDRPHGWLWKQTWHSNHSYPCCQETIAAQRCMMGTVMGVAVFDRCLLSYNSIEINF